MRTILLPLLLVATLPALAGANDAYYDTVSGQLVTPYCKKNPGFTTECVREVGDQRYYGNYYEPHKRHFLRRRSEVRLMVQELHGLHSGDYVLQKINGKLVPIEVGSVYEPAENDPNGGLVLTVIPGQRIFPGRSDSEKRFISDIRTLILPDKAKTAALQGHHGLCLGNDRVNIVSAFQNGLAEVDLNPLPLFDDLKLVQVQDLKACANVEHAQESPGVVEEASSSQPTR